MALSVNLNLEDRVAVVSGGARGMGLAYVRGFLGEGAKVVAADRAWTGLDTLKTELEGRGALCLDMDVTDDAQLDRAYAATLARFGTADVLVNNAAMRSRDLFPPAGRRLTLDTSDEDFLRLYSVNVFGALKVIRRFVRPMIEQRRGSIVNIVSSGSLFHSHGGGYEALRPTSIEQPYMSSKAALANLSFYLAAELREQNVAVNIVVPGHTRTTGFDEQNQARLAAGARPGPQPYAADHVVPVVLFLASQDASGVTGKMFDAVQWNLEHGLGGAERWLDKEFSYEALQPS
jgi:NAD(P)-dependent dehydrogenase (short-subunit alcohol dehydrogenase family)